MQLVALNPNEPNGERLDVAEVVRSRSIHRWGEPRATDIIGVDRRLDDVLLRVSRFARSTAPVLITGETGTGKELFARALYLLSSRGAGPLVSVNCAQYLEGQLIASELFGHRRGSFTGATSDHKGIFEAASGGVVFLDEIGELSLTTQAMLLRLLSEGEVMPVGETQSRRVDVRVMVATNRDLCEMVEQGRFRADLYYRLRCLHLHLPPLRERGDDWRLILNHHLGALNGSRLMARRFSDRSLRLLAEYHWPGNVREVRGLIETAFHMSDGELIEPEDFEQALEKKPLLRSLPIPLRPTAVSSLYTRLVRREGSFWTLVHESYLERNLKRTEVQALIHEGLHQTRGSYKKLLELFGMPAHEYLKFMDFLRHHKLKPDD
jgi:DNA-binding NtrC family response regulator